MEKFKFTKQIGSGVYGDVLRAIDLETLEIVAIKKMKKKFKDVRECLQLRELKVLQKLRHPNIVELEEIIYQNNELFLVFEYLENNLYEIIKDRSKLLPEWKIRNIMYQILQALHYMHKNDYFHRDLKPENILILNDTVKLADFGLVREIHSKPPFTDYISTRWYRAPEVLLRSNCYSAQIDIWAIGAIMAELYSLKPLFPGSSEIDQLFKICSVLGSPTSQNWSDGIKLANSMNFKFPNMAPNSLATLLPNASADAIDLLSELLKYDPLKRLSTLSALNHPYFHVTLPKSILISNQSHYSDLANIYLFQNGFIQSNDLKLNHSNSNNNNNNQNVENNNNITQHPPPQIISNKPINQFLRNSRYSIININQQQQQQQQQQTPVNLNPIPLLPNIDTTNNNNNNNNNNHNTIQEIEKNQLMNKIKSNIISNNNGDQNNKIKLITPRVPLINPPNITQNHSFHFPLKLPTQPTNTPSKL